MVTNTTVALVEIGEKRDQLGGGNPSLSAILRPASFGWHGLVWLLRINAGRIGERELYSVFH